MIQIRVTVSVVFMLNLVLMGGSGSAPGQVKKKGDAAVAQKKEAEEKLARKLLGDAELQKALLPIAIPEGGKADGYVLPLDAVTNMLASKGNFEAAFRERIRELRRNAGKPTDLKTIREEYGVLEAAALKGGFDSLHHMFRVYATYEFNKGDRDKRFLSADQVRTILATELEKKAQQDRYVVATLQRKYRGNVPPAIQIEK